MRRPQGCTNHLLPREVAVGFAYDPRQRTPVGTPRMPPALAEQQPCGRRTKKRLSAAYAALPLASAFRITHTGTSGSARRGVNTPRSALSTLSTVEPSKGKAPNAKVKT